MDFVVSHRGEKQTVSGEPQAVAELVSQAVNEMTVRLGPWVVGESRVDAVMASATPVSQPERPVQTFKPGEVDPSKAQRIAALQDALRAKGYDVGDQHQAFKTGTTMLDVGAETQDARGTAHAKLSSLRDAAGAFAERIGAEQRRDYILRAGDMARTLEINGALKWQGFKLQEQAVRGLLARLGSPATGYVFGLRDRIADKDATDAGKRMDKDALLDVFLRELRRHPDVECKLRLREGLGDCFAVVSPTYTPADFPQVWPDIQRNMPSDDVKGSVQYDPTTTQWEVRASIWTPTPAAEQAVGEPFSGYASFQSGDAGNSGLSGGGGIELIRCWNATVYFADDGTVRVIHRTHILHSVSRIVRNARRAIDVLAEAWGTARRDVVEVPNLVKIEDAIPGFYRSILTGRGDLVGVLRGRKEDNVKALARTFDSERRNVREVTRGDLANGFTRLAQDREVSERRDIENAVGRWLVRKPPVGFLAANA